MKEFDRFLKLFTKFQAGKRWLEERSAQGQDVTQHYTDFTENVVEPMEMIWAEFNDLEKKYWLLVDRVAYRYGLQVVDEYGDLPEALSIIVATR